MYNNHMKRIIVNTAVFIIIVYVTVASAFAAGNSLIDVRVNSTDPGYVGWYVIGVPSIPPVKLLYGYPGAYWTTYTTIKITSPTAKEIAFGGIGGTFTQLPTEGFDAANNTRNVCAWVVDGLKITQELTVVDNPRTAAAKDNIKITYRVQNQPANSYNITAGIRIMLDTQLKTFDNSPIAVQGYGQVAKEREWTGSAVPDAWIAFDDYYNPTVKAECNMADAGATKPDRLVIADWDKELNPKPWNVTVDTNYVMTDTAAGMYYNPVTYTPGQELTFTIYYGIPDYSGAELAITKSASVAEANYGDTLSFNINYYNQSTYGLSNLKIWDSIPWNATFVDASAPYTYAGGVVSWDLGAISNTYTAYSVWLRASINHMQGVSVTNTSHSEYTDSYWMDKEVKHSNQAIVNILTATVTVTPSITQTHTITPTASVTPTVTETPVALMLSLKGNYPNPARYSTNVVFYLARNADVKLKIFTVSGELVYEEKAHFPEGHNTILWNLINGAGKDVASGVYIYKLEATTERDEYAEAYSKMALAR